MTKHEKLFYMFILLVLAVVMLKIEQNVNDLKKRVYGLEKDYKIYEVNLTNLENNKEVQFEKWYKMYQKCTKLVILGDIFSQNAKNHKNCAKLERGK